MLVTRSASAPAAGHLADGVGQLGRRLRHEFDRFLGLAAQMEKPRLDLGRAHFGLADALDACHQERISRQELQHAEAVLTLADEMMRTVRRGEIAQHAGDSADRIEIAGAGIVGLGLAL